ncbi:MAG: ABC transporter permease, partial [Candidatus Hodarchaeales archaeon]
MSSNPFLMIPIRNIKRNKLRSFLLVLAVTLTVSLQIGIAISVDSLLSDFVHSQRNLNYTDITIRSKDDLTFENISDLIPLIQSVDGVGKVSIAATVPLENIVSLNDTQSGRYPLLYGCDKTHPDFSTLELKSGKRSLKPGEVIISETIAYFLEIDEGDVLTLDSVPAIGFTGANLVVSAIMYDAYPFANFENYAFVLVDYNYLKGLFDDNSQPSYYIAVSIPYLIDIN